MIVMDSGLGGISVVRALRALSPNLPLVYLADTAGFPYGNRNATDITTRAQTLIRALAEHHAPSSMVLACNTLSTLCLEGLRASFPYPFVGTVPAIKVAAGLSRSKRFTLLATPNTADSLYSRQLIAQFAGDCTVDSYGAPNLAAYAERMMLGEPIDPALLRAEIAPAFHDDGADNRTDTVVLGCTHYPLLVETLRTLAPWEVQWIDSSDAIARRALTHPDTPPGISTAYVTEKTDIARYQPVFEREGFQQVQWLPMPDHKSASGGAAGV